MCRLGFFSLKEEKDLTDKVRLFTTYFSQSNPQGTGVAWFNSKLEVEKAPENAVVFWLRKNKLQIKTDTVIWHTRFATNGSVKWKNTHPFWVGSIAMVHNGVLSNYYDAKRELEERGAKFHSDTDSEVLLWAYVFEKENFIKYLRKKEVGGTATVLIMKGRTILAYTNNKALVIYKASNGYVGASENVFGDYSVRQIKVKPHRLYFFKKGNLLSVKKVGSLKWESCYNREFRYSNWNWSYQTKIDDAYGYVYPTGGVR